MKNLILPFVALGLLSLGCQPPPAGGSKELVERIEKLEKKVAAIEKNKAPAAAARPQRAQQTEAYKIPVGESFSMGDKKAIARYEKYYLSLRLGRPVSGHRPKFT